MAGPHGYFPPGYFYPGYFTASYWGPRTVGPSDDACWDYIVQTLESSGAFDAVLFSTTPPRNLDATRAAWVQPWRVVERDDSDVDAIIRKVYYRLNLYVLAEDEDSAALSLTRLAGVARNALDVQPPGCLYLESRLGEGQYPDGAGKSYALRATSQPCYSVSMIGSFAYETSCNARNLAFA